MHVQVRMGGAQNLQYGAIWKLSLVQVGREVASVCSCLDPQKMSCASGPGLSLRMERGWEKRARTMNSGGLGAEGSNQG